MAADRTNTGSSNDADELRDALARLLLEHAYGTEKPTSVGIEVSKMLKGMDRRLQTLEQQMNRLSGLPDATAQLRLELQTALRASSSEGGASRSHDFEGEKAHLAAGLPRTPREPASADARQGSLGLVFAAVGGLALGILGTLLAGPTTGMLGFGASDSSAVAASAPESPQGSPVPGESSSTASSQAVVSAAASVSSSTSAGPPVANAGAPRSAPAGAVNPWQGIWERALKQPVTAKACLPHNTLRACLCDKIADAACTLEHGQGREFNVLPRESSSVLILQAMLMAHTPPLLPGSHPEADGRVGKGTVEGLTRLIQRCDRLMPKVQHIQVETQKQRSDAYATIAAVLKEFPASAQCLDSHTD